MSYIIIYEFLFGFVVKHRTEIEQHSTFDYIFWRKEPGRADRHKDGYMILRGLIGIGRAKEAFNKSKTIPPGAEDSDDTSFFPFSISTASLFERKEMWEAHSDRSSADEQKSLIGRRLKSWGFRRVRHRLKVKSWREMKRAIKWQWGEDKAERGECAVITADALMPVGALGFLGLSYRWRLYEQSRKFYGICGSCGSRR